jgi:hypothetical protein
MGTPAVSLLPPALPCLLTSSPASSPPHPPSPCVTWSVPTPPAGPEEHAYQLDLEFYGEIDESDIKQVGGLS